MFEVGMRVRTGERRGGHTRLPHYLAGKSGIITARLGRFPLPDSVVRDPMHPVESDLYTVAFSARDVFGSASSDVIYADLFAAYLEPGV